MFGMRRKFVEARQLIIIKTRPASIKTVTTTKTIHLLSHLLSTVDQERLPTLHNPTDAFRYTVSFTYLPPLISTMKWQTLALAFLTSTGLASPISERDTPKVYALRLVS